MTKWREDGELEVLLGLDIRLRGSHRGPYQVQIRPGSGRFQNDKSLVANLSLPSFLNPALPKAGSAAAYMQHNASIP